MLCPSPFPEKPAFIYIALVVEFLKFAYMIISSSTGVFDIFELDDLTGR